MNAVIALFPIQAKQIERKTLPSQRQLNCAKQQVICIICAATSPISHLHFPQAWLQLPQASLNQGCENFVHCLQKRNWPIILRKRSRSFVLIDGYDPRESSHIFKKQDTIEKLLKNKQIYLNSIPFKHKIQSCRLIMRFLTHLSPPLESCVTVRAFSSM